MDREMQTEQEKTRAAQDEVVRLQKELSQEHERVVRALADFENYRRRVEREQTSAAKRERQEMLLSLLQLADDFERALDHVRDSPQSVAEGLQALRRRLGQILGAYGVIPFESVGQPFDPTRHEAIGAVQSDQYPAGIVFDEVGRGYTMGDDILRPARVRVVQENG